MKLSILLISYNQEKYIKQTLDSILMQNIPFSFEVIVADDFSDDKTLDIIKDSLIGQIHNLKILVDSSNLGISKNYQRGFNACEGEYIAIIEGDDYWTDPERLIKHVRFLENHRHCVMSMNRFIVYEERINQFSFSDWNSMDDYFYINTSDMARGNKLGNLSACVFRKSEIDKIDSDLYNIAIADWMLGMVLSQNGFIAILKEMMSVYRVHENGVWSKMDHFEVKKTISLLIEEYNKFFNYKYDKEFSALKIDKNSFSFKVLKKSTIIDFIPPLLIYIIKLIMPPIVIKSISFFKKKIHI